MRNTVTGLVLAAALLAALFYASSHRAHPVLANRGPAPEAIAAAVGPGFVGSKQVGDWILSCAAKPLVIHSAQRASAKPDPAAKAGGAATGAGKSISLGRCRTILEFRRKEAPHALAMTLAFRYLGGATGRLAVFVRYGAGQKGETVLLRVGPRSLKLPVAGCGQGGCMALGILSPDAEANFRGISEGELILPAGTDGKRRGAAVPFAGLAAALAAMRRAEG